jgi:ubiquinone biosynthesis protein|tara:strand:+ start:449 stop:1882 length:1434 start_codon:yes stop_codon:yes gene_type:complete
MYKEIRNILKLFRIINSLAIFGVLFCVKRIKLPSIVYWYARIIFFLSSQRYQRLTPGEKLCRSFIKLGPSFIKLGQSLATRPDIIGDKVAYDLSQLQDKLPPFHFDQVKETIENELEMPIHKIFKTFKKEPLAAASIAQVHFATTIEGRKVAVKILRPKIENAFEKDINFFYWLVKVAESIKPELQKLNLIQIVKTFAQTVRIEMDLRLEAAAAAELRENFSDHDYFYVPKIDWDRTSKRVLTLEKISGIKIDSRESLLKKNKNPDEILKKCTTALFKQIFEDGFFHADVHPGNQFLDKKGRIAVIDFGIMGRVDFKTRNFLAEILLGFLNGDYVRVAKIHFQAGYVPKKQSEELFAQACRAVGEPIMQKPANEISIAELIAQLLKIAQDFEMEAQPQLFLLQKTMLVSEGLGRKLNPKINVWELTRPLMEEWLQKNKNPRKKIEQTIDNIGFILDHFPELMKKLESLTSQLERERN